MNPKLVTVSALAGLQAAACLAAPKAQQPNIIYIFPDQMRNHAMGFWSEDGFREHVNFTGDPVHTPELDRFARESAVLTSACSTSPISSPHRAMLLTGMYPDRNGVSLNCNTERPFNFLRPEATTISDVLSGLGYECAYFGKYHLDFPTPDNPQQPGTYVNGQAPGDAVRDNPVWDAYTPPGLRHGFSYWYSYGTFDEHKNPHYWDNNGQRHDPKEWSPKHEADKIISYLRTERDRDKPLLLMWSINPPHSPYSSLRDCMEEDYNLYKDIPARDLLVRPNAAQASDKNVRHVPYYYASVSGVDRAFGRVLDALKELGLEENTIVVFSSDHGDMMCSQDRLGKGAIYAESYNVPFIVRYPGHVKPHVTDLMLSTTDIMPTLLSMAGHEGDIPSKVRGKDLSGFLLGRDDMEKAPQATLFLMDGFGLKRDYAKKLVCDAFPRTRGVKTRNWSLSISVNPKSRQITETLLFNDGKDPYQLNNLKPEEHPEAFRELCRELARLLREADDPWYKMKILSDLIPYKS